MKVIVYVALYIDDNLDRWRNFGVKKQRAVLKVVEGLQGYLSCEIKFSENKKRAWLAQSHLIENLKNKFKNLIEDVRSHKTPGTPKFLIVRPTEEREKISIEDQWIYQSGVGMLLYLVKHFRPNIANMTRELSKANNGANLAAYKELLRVIKYVVKTERTHREFQQTLGNYLFQR